MNAARRTFLRQVMDQAWAIYRQRGAPGSIVQTFADAMRRAWAWVKDAADREAARVSWAIAPRRVVRLAPMVASPIRRSLAGARYAGADAASRGYVTSAFGR